MHELGFVGIVPLMRRLPLLDEALQGAVCPPHSSVSILFLTQDKAGEPTVDVRGLPVLVCGEEREPRSVRDEGQMRAASSSHSASLMVAPTVCHAVRVSAGPEWALRGRRRTFHRWDESIKVGRSGEGSCGCAACSSVCGMAVRVPGGALVGSTVGSDAANGSKASVVRDRSARSLSPRIVSPSSLCGGKDARPTSTTTRCTRCGHSRDCSRCRGAAPPPARAVSSRFVAPRLSDDAVLFPRCGTRCWAWWATQAFEMGTLMHHGLSDLPHADQRPLPLAPTTTTSSSFRRIVCQPDAGRHRRT